MADSRRLWYTSVVVTLIYWQKCNASIFNWPCYRRARHDNRLDRVYVILVSINTRARAPHSRSPGLTSTRRCLLRGIFDCFYFASFFFFPSSPLFFVFAFRHTLTDCTVLSLRNLFIATEQQTERGSSGERFSAPQRLASLSPTLCPFVNLQSFTIVYYVAILPWNLTNCLHRIV